MARWMILYSDDNGGARAAIISDPTNGNLPFGVCADEVIGDLPDRNPGGTTFIVELEDHGEPTVYANDEEVGRTFIDL